MPAIDTTAAVRDDADIAETTNLMDLSTVVGGHAAARAL